MKFQNTKSKEEWIQDSRGVMAWKWSQCLETTWKVRTKMDIDIYSETTGSDGQKMEKEKGNEQKSNIVDGAIMWGLE